MIVDNDIKLDYCDVLIVPRESELISRSQVDIEVDHFGKSIVPIIAANMDGIGTFEMASALGKYKIATALIKHYSVDDLVEYFSGEDSNYAIYSMGTSDSDYEKFVQFNNLCSDGGITHPSTVCIDVANGYTNYFLEFVARIFEEYPDYVIMAGNVVTPERTEKLIEAGANIVKIGIGSGSVCTTRTMTGVGYPQLSAVLECSVAATDSGGSIVADGGITCVGDIVKAYSAGAKYVMVGGMLAGHQEGWNGTDIIDGKNFIPFYGMASKVAQDKYNGGVAEYRASEGREVKVPYRGYVRDTISSMLGGIRSACTYVGAENIEQLHRKAKFIKVNRVLNNVAF